MNLGKAIKELRKDARLSQVDLAKKVGITQAALSGIENGNRPAQETLKNISRSLGIPESLIYVMGMEKGDVAEGKQALYEELFPVIQALVKKVAGPNLQPPDQVS